MEQISRTSIQAKAFEFALLELIYSKRDSFQPLWSVDSWAKFLIWLSLCCQALLDLDYWFKTILFKKNLNYFVQTKFSFQKTFGLNKIWFGIVFDPNFFLRKLK